MSGSLISQKYHNQLRSASDVIPSMHSAAPKGDVDGITGATQATGKTPAANATGSYSLSVQCPQCSHRFRLADCLLLTTAATNSALTQLTVGADAVEPVLSDEDWNSVVEFAQRQENEDRRHKAGNTADGENGRLDANPPPDHASHNWSPPESCRIVDECCCEVSTDGDLLEPAGNSNSRDTTCSSPATGRIAFCDCDASAGAGCNSAAVATAAATEASATASDVVRNFLIVNITMEQLERIIMDKTDRRIRRISGVSGCCINLRSELPAGRFGVAKNFCLLRSRFEHNIDSCRLMLSRQLGWNLVAKPN